MPVSRKQKKDRKNRKNRKQGGGASQRGGVGPVGLYDLKHLSNSQGADFLSRHVTQHGGMAPVGYTGVLDESLRLSARVTPLDHAIEQSHQVRDPGQSGGRKNRKNRKTQRKNRKASRKVSRKTSRKVSRKTSRKASRKTSRKASRKASRKNRKQSGGRGFVFPEDMSYGTATGPGMLLPPGTNAGLHKEWADAANVRSMMPKA